MKHDYFYGSQSESFAYFRIPRLLVRGEQYGGVSIAAKLLYGLLLDRMGLSAKNRWLDELGRVYIHYTLEEIMQDMGCSHTTACKLLSELDESRGCGLIERVKQGQGRPTRIYVKQFTDAGSSPPATGLPEEVDEEPALPDEPDEDFQNQEVKTSRNEKSRLQHFGSQDFKKTEVRTSRNEKSRLQHSGSQDFKKVDTSYTDISYPDISYTDPSIHPPYPPPSQPPDDLDDGWMDGTMEEHVREQIDFPFLAESYPYDDPGAILDVICDVLSGNEPEFRINGGTVPGRKVRDRFRRLTFDHVCYVLDSLWETPVRITNMRSYLIAALYNAPVTIGIHTAAKVRHDFKSEEEKQQHV